MVLTQSSVYLRCHRRWTAIALTQLALLPLGCAANQPATQPAEPGQSYVEALELICHVDERAGIDPLADPIGVDTARWDYIKAEVRNPDAIYFRTLLEVKATDEQAELLAAEADRKQLDGCPLVDALGRG